MRLPKRLNYLARRALDAKYERVMAAKAAAAREVAEYMEMRASYGLPAEVEVGINDEDNTISIVETPATQDELRERAKQIVPRQGEPERGPAPDPKELETEPVYANGAKPPKGA